MTRWMIVAGCGLLALAAVVYFQGLEEAEVVEIVVTDADRDLTLRCGVTHSEEFRIPNPTGRVVRVIGLAEC